VGLRLADVDANHDCTIEEPVAEYQADGPPGASALPPPPGGTCSVLFCSRVNYLFFQSVAATFFCSFQIEIARGGSVCGLRPCLATAGSGIG
jgi:hypothetical protein